MKGAKRHITMPTGTQFEVAVTPRGNKWYVNVALPGIRGGPAVTQVFTSEDDAIECALNWQKEARV